MYKFLKNVLKNVINQNNYYIKDSFDLKNQLKNITIPDKHILISLDVVSLYTNIPIELAISTITKNEQKLKNLPTFH